jgi:hypothetical protein
MAKYDTTYAKWLYLILLALLTGSGLGGGVRDRLQGLLVDDISNNASYTAHISNVESTQLFARQHKTCSLPVPWYSCPGGVHCCSTADRCLPGGCCPRESVVCNTRVCLEPGSTCCGDTGCPLGTTCRTIEGKTGCCPRTAETCGGTACLSAGQTCCGDGACKDSAFCRKSSNGRYACCPSSDDVACDEKTCMFSPFLILTDVDDMLTSGSQAAGLAILALPASVCDLRQGFLHPRPSLLPSPRPSPCPLRSATV